MALAREVRAGRYATDYWDEELTPFGDLSHVIRMRTPMPAMTRHLNDCSSKTDGAHAPISHAFGERAVLKFVFAVLQAPA